MSFLATIVVVLVVLQSTLSHASSLIRPFGECAELNNYYVNNLLPYVGPRGIRARNIYVDNFRRDKDFGDFAPGTPGGPVGLALDDISANGNPRDIVFSNITVDNDNYSAEPDGAMMEDGAPVAGVDYSTTNNQVEGVDEPDIIKTDGKRVFTLTNSIFSSVEVQDGGKTGERKGKLKLPTWAFEMLFEGDWVLAIGTDYNFNRPISRRFKDPTIRYGGSTTVIYQINVADMANPRLVSTLRMEGSYVESREVEGVARVVVKYNPLTSLKLMNPSDKYSEAQTEKWNREIIQYSQAANWLPTYQLERFGQVQNGIYASCASTFVSSTAFSGYSIVSIVTLPIDGLLSPTTAASVLSAAEKVYSTTESLYVTTSEFQRDESPDAERWAGDYVTSFHKFNVTNEAVTFLASGSVSGSVLNQFSMHEHKGIFFIATTDGAFFWRNRDESKSKVTAFEENKTSRELVQIGEADNLGLGERIYSVRYLDDTAYVVTFRQIDPLYIIDLSDPYNLRVTGELKIPGFSSYLHYVGPGRILGVGQEATLEGRTTGAKVSLFDVSDKTNPVELSSWSLLRSFSNAQWDHRAFLFWWREGIAVMPVSVYSPERFNGAVVLNVSEQEITERGRVRQRIAGRSYDESIRRNAIVGQTNLWSMSYEILQVNDINELDKVTGQITIVDD